MSIKVIPTSNLYKGKTYSQWIPEWCNWFYMMNPDQYNTEHWNDVKFLRSFPSPEKIFSLSDGKRIQYEGSPSYRNTPNIMVGKDRITLYEGQAIFFPIMNAIWIDDDPESKTDFGLMERWVKDQNAQSDDPPMSYQCTIDGKILVKPDEMSYYKVHSDGVFSLKIPHAEFGKSLNDYVLHPSPPGWYQAYCQGYFIMVDGFEPREDSYFIFSIAKGAPYNVGEYYASFLYEIKVLPSTLKPRPSQSGNFSEKIMNSMRDNLSEKSTSKEIDEYNFKYWTNLIENVLHTHDYFVTASLADRKNAAISSIIKLGLMKLKTKITLSKENDVKNEEIFSVVDKLEKWIESNPVKEFPTPKGNIKINPYESITSKLDECENNIENQETFKSKFLELEKLVKSESIDVK